MMIEESAELTKALLNERRGRDNNIAEEMADVWIMLEQMAVIFQNAGEVERIFREKVTRLDQRSVITARHKLIPTIPTHKPKRDSVTVLCKLHF